MIHQHSCMSPPHYHHRWDRQHYQDCQHCRRQWRELYLYCRRWRYICDMKADSLYSHPWSYRFTMVSTFVPGQAVWTALSSTIQERGKDREIRQKKKGIAMTYCSKGLHANLSGPHVVHELLIIITIVIVIVGIAWTTMFAFAYRQAAIHAQLSEHACRCLSIANCTDSCSSGLGGARGDEGMLSHGNLLGCRCFKGIHSGMVRSSERNTMVLSVRCLESNLGGCM